MQPDWNNITADELSQLYTRMSAGRIAELYQVSIGKVRYKLRKYKITIKQQIYQEFLEQNDELLQELNTRAKERLLQGNLINQYAKAITHFAFRNGPVENMHSMGKLSEEDMKELNQFMVNRIAGLLVKMFDGQWLQIELLLSYYEEYGTNWDQAIPDTHEFEFSWDRFLDEFANSQEE